MDILTERLPFLCIHLPDKYPARPNCPSPVIHDPFPGFSKRFSTNNDYSKSEREKYQDFP